MSREIKFRVWHTAEKVMEYPEKPFKKDADYWDGIYGTVLEIFSSYLNQPERIFLQYTGLKDKNGKEIYESDIVRAFNSVPEMGINKVVVWRGAKFLFERGEQDWRYRTLAVEDCEVIGNIYEDPQMIPDPNWTHKTND